MLEDFAVGEERDLVRHGAGEVHRVGDQNEGAAFGFEVGNHLEDLRGHFGIEGGGKSTLLRVIGGLETPEQGTIRVDGQNVPQEENPLRLYRRHFGTVFQSWNLF
ncbi:MAG: ATP-binding cassette domain-containing protein, partial [Chthoniobacterales bacterium]